MQMNLIYRWNDLTIQQLKVPSFIYVVINGHACAIPLNHLGSHGDGSAENGLHFAACRIEVHYVWSVYVLVSAQRFSTNPQLH
jgi:hypothetical protein